MATQNDTLRAAVRHIGMAHSLFVIAEMCHAKADELNDHRPWTKLAEALEELGRDAPTED